MTLRTIPLLAAAVLAAAGVATAHTTTSPIRHVVVVIQENHSFDNVLGRWCSSSGRCDGATSGVTHTGQTVQLTTAADVVAEVQHTVAAQAKSLDRGRMDGFDRIQGCDPPALACYTQYQPQQIPNLSALAAAFAVSDRTFEFAGTPSWAGHLVFAAATNDGFGDNPQGGGTGRVGWGCDSGADAPWWNGSSYVLEPSCVPDRQGRGPYRQSPVPYVPTIFDRLDGAGLPWRVYGALAKPGSGYGWTICPAFYECLGSGQHQNLVPASDVLADAAAGSLPAFSIVTPTAQNSQHNSRSMLSGDNWVGSVAAALMAGPQWGSTAVFVTYDDCGCFYDHVPPPNGWGIRVPMVIASPYAKPGYTDSSAANFASVLAFAEHVFALAPLNGADGSAYDYMGAFDFSRRPGGTVPRMVTRRLPAGERAWLRAHPALDQDDPT